VKSLWLSPFLLFAAGPAVPSAPAAPPPALHRHEATRMSMASAYAILAYGADGGALPGIVEAALDEVDRIDRLMSHYKPESPLSRLNREAPLGPVAVDPELRALIVESIGYARASGGAFDITVGPLMKTWGFFRGGGRLPTEAEVAEARTRVGYAHVVVDGGRGTVRFDRPGVELDLGGIAKGYAVDRAVQVLRRAHVAAALVSAGGSTIYGLGAPPGREAWEVEVQDPLDGTRAAFTVPLRDRALSISGSSEKWFETGGVRYSHVMDPRTGRPVQGVLGVAVLAPTGTAGDALDNALFVLGPEKARAYLAGIRDTEAAVFLPTPEGWRMERLSGAGKFPADRSTAP
jgi:thiamine biosynthesis lipoprotein